MSAALLLSASRRSIDRAAEHLLSLQQPDGYWCALLTADTTLESDYILLQLWLHPPVRMATGIRLIPGQIRRAAERILSQQLPDGGFNIYVKGPSEISAQVKAYFALKLAGMLAIRTNRVWRGCANASLRSAAFRRPTATPKSISACSISTRAKALPAFRRRSCCCRASCSTRCLPGRGPSSCRWPSCMRMTRNAPCRPASIWMSSSFAGKSTAFENNDSWLSWRKTFIHSDKILKLWESYGFARIRSAAIRKCEHWMLERMKHAEGLGAIYPPMQYSIMALDVLGYAKDHPVRVEAIRQFDRLMVDDGKTLFFQPCFSPVWDTAIGAYALGEAPASAESVNRNVFHASMTKAADWLLDA